MDVRERVETWYDRRFHALATALLRRGARPNHLTFLQLPVFLLEIWCAQNGWAWPFVLLIGFVIILDGLDGMMARAGGLQSNLGAVLDALFDTLGIGIVLWGAGLFQPWAQTPLMLLFFANIVLFLQNALLGTKMIAYLRGPILIGILVPDAMPAALVLSTAILLWLILARLRPTMKALAPRLMTG